jgi:hypothetical protein
LAGIVIVVSAGNEGNEASSAFDPNSPSPFAQALLASGNGLVIISTSVDDNDVISNFSNKAGVAQNAVLSALGQGICCEYQNDTIYRFVENGQSLIRVSLARLSLRHRFPSCSFAGASLSQSHGAQIVNCFVISAMQALPDGCDLRSRHIGYCARLCARWNDVIGGHNNSRSAFGRWRYNKWPDGRCCDVQSSRERGDRG